MITRQSTALISVLAWCCVTVSLARDATEPMPADAHSNDVVTSETEALKQRADAAANAAKDAAAVNSEMTARAKETAKAVHSEAFQALIGEMSPRLLEVLGVEDGADAEMNPAAPPMDHPELMSLVFASSSIPLSTLRNYAAQLEPIGGAIVIRGGVGGLKEMSPTINFIMSVLKVDPSCDSAACDMRDVSILIDPVLFAQAGVARVPAVAVVDHDPFVSYCERETDAARSDGWIITYGDASLRGHFEELERRGETRAKIMLTAIRQETE